MIRTTITPETTNIQLEIPAEYIGREIEITVLALDEAEGGSNGTSSDFSDPTAALIQEQLKKEREKGFDRSGQEKYFKKD
jgi:hypothetical protein